MVSSVGVSVPNPTDVGDLIQGNFIGQYVTFLVDPQTGRPCRRTQSPLPASAMRTKESCWALPTQPSAAPIPGRQCHRRQRSAGCLDRARLVGQPSPGQPDRRDRAGRRILLPAGNGAEGVLIESTSNVHRSTARATSSRRTRVTAFISRASGRRETWSRPTTSVRPPAAATSSAAAIPATAATASGSTTRPITRSAVGSASDGNVISSNAGNGVNVTGADADGQHASRTTSSA